MRFNRVNAQAYELWVLIPPWAEKGVREVSGIRTKITDTKQIKRVRIRSEIPLKEATMHL